MSDDLNKLTEDFRALGRKEGAVHPATEEHYTNKERARWVAAVEEIRRLAEKDATPYEPVHPSKYFDQFARMLLTRMEVES